MIYTPAPVFMVVMKNSPVPYERLILVCVNTRPEGESSCGARSGAALAEALKAAVGAAGLKGRIRVSRTQCLGLCELGPNVMVFPEGRLLSGVGPEDVPKIVEEFVRSEKK